MTYDMNGWPRPVNVAGLFAARLLGLGAFAAMVVIPATVLVRVALSWFG